MKNNKEIRNVGILTGALIVIFIVLFCINLPAIKVNRLGLASDIQNVLDLNSENNFTVNKPMLVKSPLQSTLAIYKLVKSENALDKNILSIDDLSYACIIRITGICGPTPVIYVYSKTFGAKFIGIAGTNIQNQDYKANGLSYTQIQYWGEKISNIIEETANE